MLERLQRRQDLYEFREKFRTVLDSKPAMQNTSTYYKNNTEYIQRQRKRKQEAYSNSSLWRCRRAGTPSSRADTNSLKVQSYSLATASFYATVWSEEHEWEWNRSVININSIFYSHQNSYQTQIWCCTSLVASSLCEFGQGQAGFLCDTLRLPWMGARWISQWHFSGSVHHCFGASPPISQWCLLYVPYWVK